MRVALRIADGGNGASLKAGPDPWVHAFRGLAIFSCALPRPEAKIGVHNVSGCHAFIENSMDMEKILEQHREYGSGPSKLFIRGTGVRATKQASLFVHQYVNIFLP